MRIPEEKDLVDYNSLDEIDAKNWFRGKDIDEAKKMLENGGIETWFRFSYLSDKSFAFYMHAVKEYMNGDSSKEDYLAVDLIESLISKRMKEDGFGFALDVSMATIKVILDNWAKYKVFRKDYCKIRGKYQKLLNRIEKIDRNSRHTKK